MTATDASVTEQVAEWIVKADYDDIPTIAIERLRNVVLDSFGNQFAGMSVSTGRILSEWVRAQGGRPDQHRHRSRLQDDAVARHARQRRGVARARERRHRHVQQPPQQPAHRGRRSRSGRSSTPPGATSSLAWLIGWEITATDDEAGAWGRPATSSSTGAGSTRASRRRSVSPRWPPSCSSSMSPDAHGDRPRRVGHGRDDEEPRERHQGVHGRERGHARRDRRRAGGDGLHRQRGHPRRRDRGRADARSRAGRRREDPRRAREAGTWRPAGRRSGCTRAAARRTGAWTRCSTSCAGARRQPEEVDAIDVEINDFLIDMVPYPRPADRAGGEVQPRIRHGHHHPRRARRHPSVHRRHGAATAGTNAHGARHDGADEWWCARQPRRAQAQDRGSSSRRRSLSRTAPRPTRSRPRRSSASSTSARRRWCPRNSGIASIDLCGRLETLENVRELADAMGANA